MKNYGIIKNSKLSVWYSKNQLRVSGLVAAGSPNLFADLADTNPVQTQYGDFHFSGGHRLWHAPEAMPRSYIPDKFELSIIESANQVILETPLEPITNIRKKMSLELDPERARLKITHTLFNDGLWPVRLAPWAITQLRIGGTAILPLNIGKQDASGLLPNRSLSLWSYTDLKDSRLTILNDVILFKALPIDQAFKIGTFNRAGWLAYLIDGIVFKKSFDVVEGPEYPDAGCNAEIFGYGNFVELESLAGFSDLEPGHTVSHVEVWEVGSAQELLPERIIKLLG